ncbi:transposase [Cupriavidus necator]
MSMNEFRRLAAKIDQHMQQLAALGVSDTHAIINRMMGYVPNLHKIWAGTSDQQLMALSHEFPEFYRYALIMEEASEAERNKASRPYDGMAEFSEEHKQRAAQLLVTGATLERGYQAFRGSSNLQIFQPQVNELGRLHRQWLSELDSFKSALRAQGAEPRALGYVNEAFGLLADRIKQLAG